MRVTVPGLRRWIVSVAALLLVVVVGFFFYGRLRLRRIERDLPARLGANIQQTARGFTYSQSSQGHTIFTLKASRLVQLRAGHALLHDVDITLYGPPGSGRADRIYGSDFDYDQNGGVATSKGDVNIEIESLSKDTRQGSGDKQGYGGRQENGTIRVRTSGLTFVQKTGQASTPNYVQFQLPRAAGSSVGASYDSRAGVLVLNSQVHLTSSSDGHAAVVDAQHARLLRASMQAFLDQALLNYQTTQGRSDHATVSFRKDGTADRVDATGHVHLTSDSGAAVDSSIAHILLDPKSQPTRADLAGGVQFASGKTSSSAMQGSAAEGTLFFATADGQTALHHAQFRRTVRFTQQLQGLPKDPRGQARKQLQAEKVDVDFIPAGQSRASGQRGVEASRAIADGSPVLTTEEMPSKSPRQTTRIAADHLVATLDPGNVLRRLDGTGNTHVTEESGDGARNTTRGDVLHATFRQEEAARVRLHSPAPPASGKHRRGADSGQTTLETAIQDGHVMLTETPAKKPSETAAPSTLTAWAEHAEYHTSDQVLHLTGTPSSQPRMTDSASMQLSADAIDYHRDTQDASASGSVKATYTQQSKSAPAKSAASAPGMGGSGPVHVIAARAEMNHATSQSTFYGSARMPARMWQDTDSLLAPVIEVDRAKNLLRAHAGKGEPAEPVVNANFTTAMGAHHQQTVVRVHSQTLVFSDNDRRGDFRGSVTAEQGSDVIRCDEASVFLKPEKGAKTPAPAENSAKSPAGESSRIDRMVAGGHVVFTEPGRRGEGSRLVYTADNGQYVLTGTPSNPPRMTDRVHGTTTGEALLFNSQDDSVEISGGKSSAVTDTRAPK